MNSQDSETETSIILCTYNPHGTLLDRVLRQCIEQQTTKRYEIIVVDNNSSPSVAITPHSKITLIKEPTPGLAHARMAGFRVCKGQNIVFVDDDNLIATDYLDQLSALWVKYPDVAVWGPGIIDLEYQSKPPEWIRRHFGHMYQEKSRKEIQFGKSTEWPEYYPAGSGMAVRRTVLEKYKHQFEAGTLTVKGRTGTTLSSGEDSQIVWTAVKMGKQAGTSPGLKLTHLIPAGRLTLGYLTRLQFNVASGYCRAMAEMFPEKKSGIKPLSLPGQANLFLRVLIESKFRPLLFYRKYKVANAWFSGIRDWANQV